jgi:hypothetical protein
MWLVVAGCADGGIQVEPPWLTDDTTDTDAVGGTSETESVTWHKDIRPIVDQRCMGCHATGGVAPFPMDNLPETWDAVPIWATASVDAVMSGQMPPWNLDQDCYPVTGERVVPEEEKAVFQAWKDGGYRAGDPATYVAVPPEAGPDAGFGDPAMVLPMVEPFIPDMATPDDYRCFILDYDASVERWMNGFRVLPDHAEMVHHVILYQLDEAWADDVAAWDAADDIPGYDCLFDAGTWESAFLAGWAPGQMETHFQQGVARRLPVGSKLILQLHYNTQNLNGVAPPADQSAIGLYFLEGQVPSRELVSIPFPLTDLYLPAGDSSVVIEETINFIDVLGYVPEELAGLIDLLSGVIDVVGVFPHMHNLGSSIGVDVIDGDGTQTCMVRIEEWDFAWQQSYQFPEEHWWSPNTEQGLHLRCEFDNSAANQPVFNGVQQEPRDVGWGEGTTDEMCLVFFEVLLPIGLF